ncbi:MAG: hypothetical protein WCC28_03855 [Mycobacterium sp.]
MPARSSSDDHQQFGERLVAESDVRRAEGVIPVLFDAGERYP